MIEDGPFFTMMRSACSACLAVPKKSKDVNIYGGEKRAVVQEKKLRGISGSAERCAGLLLNQCLRLKTAQRHFATGAPD
jgi:hypothetical protein